MVIANPSLVDTIPRGHFLLCLPPWQWHEWHQGHEPGVSRPSARAERREAACFAGGGGRGTSFVICITLHQSTPPTPFVKQLESVHATPPPPIPTVFFSFLFSTHTCTHVYLRIFRYCGESFVPASLFLFFGSLCNCFPNFANKPPKNTPSPPPPPPFTTQTLSTRCGTKNGTRFLTKTKKTGGPKWEKKKKKPAAARDVQRLRRGRLGGRRVPVGVPLRHPSLLRPGSFQPVRRDLPPAPSVPVRRGRGGRGGHPPGGQGGQEAGEEGGRCEGVCVCVCLGAGAGAVCGLWVVVGGGRMAGGRWAVL